MYSLDIPDIDDENSNADIWEFIPTEISDSDFENVDTIEYVSYVIEKLKDFHFNCTSTICKNSMYYMKKIYHSLIEHQT